MMIFNTVSNVFSAIKADISSLVPMLILLIYTLFGALLFLTIESPNEIYLMKEREAERARLVDQTAFTLNTIRADSTPIEIYNRTVQLLHRYRRQLNVTDIDQPQWDMWTALFYVFCVYTTIGYGDVVPITSIGRFLTIIYAFIGIPLALIVLIRLGRLLARLCKWLWMIASRTMSCLSINGANSKKQQYVDDEKFDRCRDNDDSNCDDKDDAETMLNFPVVSLIALTIVFVFMCAGLFLCIEDEWDYGTSLYFTLISFTTIGFGDVLPTNRQYMMLIALLLLIGLALVSTVISVIQEQIASLSIGMRQSIDTWHLEQSNNAPQDQQQPQSIDQFVGNLSTRRRLLYGLMPETDRRMLRAHLAHKCAMVQCAVQTDQPMHVDRMTTSAMQTDTFIDVDSTVPTTTTITKASRRQRHQSAE